MARIFLILFLMLLGLKSWSSSCCGQSPSSFVVLSLQQKLSLLTSYSFIESQGRVFNSPQFHIWQDKNRQIQALRLTTAATLADRHQVFVNAAVLQGAYSDLAGEARAQNLSDTQLGYTFEALPEYRFSYWKPVLYLSAIINAPTGRSIYDSGELNEATDVTGHNQWGVGLGVTLRKVYFPLTITIQGRALQIFSKQFESLRVSDYFDNSLALLFNYASSFENIALNFGLTASQISPRSISTTPGLSGVTENTTVTLGLQRPFDDNWSVGLGYADQTLLGRARNTILNRTYSLNLNYNYF